MQNFAHTLRESLFPTVVGTSIVWALLIATFVVRTVYYDHQSLAGRNQSLVHTVQSLENAPPAQSPHPWELQAGVQGGPFGPIFSVEIVQLFTGGIQPCRVKVLANVDKLGFRNALAWVLQYGAHCTIEGDPPTRNLDDGADIYKSRSEPGLTIRWNKKYASGETVAHFFSSSGFKVETSNNMPSASPQDLIILDFGPGSPWI